MLLNMMSLLIFILLLGFSLATPDQDIIAIQKKLESMCYTEVPETSAFSPDMQEDDLTGLKTLVEQHINSSAPDVCRSLGMCRKPEKWMLMDGNIVSDDGTDQFEERIKPVPKNKSQPLIVATQFYLESISSVNELDQEFDVSLFVVQNWTVAEEPCAPYYKAMVSRKIGEVPMRETQYLNSAKAKLGPEHFDILWMPDLFIFNAKDVYRQVSSIDTEFLDLKVFRSGDFDDDPPGKCCFTYTQRMGARIGCHMNFRFYPLDVHVCPVSFRSFGHPETDLKLKLLNVTFNPEISLGDQVFEMKGKLTKTRLFGKKYSVVSLNIIFKRVVISNLVGDYIPSFLVVIIAFTSFWLGLSFLGDRINIGMICLLTILTQFRQSRSHVPPTSIITFLDFWMILCIIMVVVQLLQTTLVYYLYNREKDLIVIRAEAEEKRKRKEQSFFSQQVPYEIRKVVESNDHEYRRRRRVYYGKGDKKDHHEEESKGKSDHADHGFWEPLWEFERFLFEPPAKRSSPEYVPMKFDSVSRVVILSFFITACITYWIILFTVEKV